MSSDIPQDDNYEKVKKSKRSSSPDKETVSSKKSRRDNSDSEYKLKKRRERSSSRDRKRNTDRSDRENYKRKYYDDDDQNWNQYTRNNDVRVGSRYYEPYRYKDDENESYRDRDAEQKQEPLKPIERKPRPEKKEMDILTRSGGAYIPPAKLKMMQAQITDKSSAAYQRIAWEALKKSIHGHINKVNTTNIGIIVRELFKENVVRGRGLLCRSIIQAQAASLTFTHVYAALVSVINSKFPNIGELLLKRLIIQFLRGFKRNDKSLCISAASFIAHLVNQNVAHEVLALELVTLLISSPTNDSIEVAIAFLKESGMKLTQDCKKGLQAIFEMLRNILHEGNLEKRVIYMIEVIFQIRKDNFEAHEAVLSELDIVEENDQNTHVIGLDEKNDPENILNVFKLDPEYEANELKYSKLRKEILDESSDESGSGDEDDESDSSEDEEEADKENKEKADVIIDATETNLMELRRTIYLAIRSSVGYEECAHKLLRMQLKPGQESELCHMILDACAELRTFEKFYGLLAQRFCVINKMYVGPFENIFGLTYATIHRLDTNKLRNVAKFFAHLLFSDSISWTVLEKIRLNEEETTSSSRIFIKILFQELSEYMGLANLNGRVKDPTMQSAFDGIFPRDNPKNTRFAINFFTSIGLGGLTDDLREHLKALPKVPVIKKIAQDLSSSSSDSSDSSSSDSGSDSSSSSSGSNTTSSDSSDSEPADRTNKKTLTKNKKTYDSGKKYKSNEKDMNSKKSKNSKEEKRKKKNGTEDDDDDDIVFLTHKKIKERYINREPKKEKDNDVVFVKNNRRIDDGRDRRKYYEEEEGNNERERRRDYYEQQTRNKDRRYEYNEDKPREKGRRREYDEGRMKEKKDPRKESNNEKYRERNRHDERKRKESEKDKYRNKYDDKERYRESDRKKEMKYTEKETDREYTNEKSTRI